MEDPKNDSIGAEEPANESSGINDGEDPANPGVEEAIGFMATDFMEISYFLQGRGHKNIEGCIINNKNQALRVRYYINSNRKPLKKMLQIGFNGGHGSHYYLKECIGLTMDTIDAGEHPYTEDSEYYVNTKHPDRHTLAVGDSTKIIPDLPDQKYDYIIIDGSHEYEVAKKDLENIKRFCTKDTIVIFDDVYYEDDAQWWNEGPTKVWVEAVKDNVVTQLEYVKGGMSGVGCAIGKYNL